MAQLRLGHFCLPEYVTLMKDLSHVNPTIRPFYDRDLDLMKKIEKRAFVDYPWTSEDFAFFLRRLNKDHEAYIAEWQENILGFMLVIRSEWSYEIASLAVSPEFRRIGVGKQLVDYLKNKLIPYSREDIYARVRESNKQGVLFFEEQGFVALELQSNYYENTTEGAYKMKYEMAELPLKKEYAHL